VFSFPPCSGGFASTSSVLTVISPNLAGVPPAWRVFGSKFFSTFLPAFGAYSRDTFPPPSPYFDHFFVPHVVLTPFFALGSLENPVFWPGFSEFLGAFRAFDRNLFGPFLVPCPELSFFCDKELPETNLPPSPLAVHPYCPVRFSSVCPGFFLFHPPFGIFMFFLLRLLPSCSPPFFPPPFPLFFFFLGEWLAL